MLISIISPVFNEEECVELFQARLKAVLEGLDSDWEVVLVNDGSSDGTGNCLDAFHKQDNRWRAIHLARNFGHQSAITAGIDSSRGDVIIVMDSDLQDSPEDIPKLIDEWRKGYQVVYAIREGRKESLYKRFAYKIFYRLLGSIAEISIPFDSGDFSLMDRKVVEVLKSLPERRRFVRGLRSWVGFRQIGIRVERGARAAGEPKYTLRKLLRLASDGLVSFSWVPLRMLTLVGLAAVIASLAYLFVVVLLRFGGFLNLPGWTTVVFLLICFGGMQLLGLGLVGEYVGRIYDEVKGRPIYVIASSTDEIPRTQTEENRK